MDTSEGTIRARLLKGASIAALATAMLMLSACASPSDSADDEGPNSSNSDSSESSSESSESNDDAEDGENVAAFNLNQGGVDSTLTYYADGDEVVRQTTVNVIDYAEAGFADADDAKAYFDPLVGQFQGVKGLTHNMEYGDTSATETMEIDYTVADLSEISELTGSSFSGDVGPGSKLSLEQSRQMLLDQGYTEVD